MATWEKTSLLIEQQFPDFVRDEGPNLIAFLKAYYEWMEQEGEVVERSQNLANYRDIDNTLDQFIQYFQYFIFNGYIQTCHWFICQYQIWFQ